MCCCGKPTKNGETGAYSWDGKTFMTRQPDPPDIKEGDTILFDEPGRCGGTDSHCHHVRLVRSSGCVDLLVRHGGGDERIRSVSHSPTFVPMLEGLSSDARYWFLLAIHHAASKASSEARQAESQRWAAAFIDKRIKRRKRGGSVSVWVESRTAVPI